jgi:murein DD-endopeptidase MepM/ murein hydrolase activator NlpD
MEEVARVNGIRNVNEIKAGQTIFIPGAEKVLHVDIHIEDLGPAVQKPTTVQLAKVKGRFVWPVKGRIIRRFGRNQGVRHDGIDVAAPWGTTVKSADSGTVIYSGDEIKGYGNIIIVKHGRSFSSVYAHNSENLVREGDRVQKGQAIARVGETGRAEAPHLHFEIRNHNKPIDPLLVLP